MKLHCYIMGDWNLCAFHSFVMHLMPHKECVNLVALFHNCFNLFHSFVGVLQSWIGLFYSFVDLAVRLISLIFAIICESVH